MRTTRIFHPISAIIYTLLMVWVYQINISEKWGYMGFHSIDSRSSIFVVLVLAASLSFFIPSNFSTRGFFLTLIHYAFFIPSLIIIASHDLEFTHLAALVVSVGLIFGVSAISLKEFRVKKPDTRGYFFISLSLILFNVLAMAAFGGLSHFNLNIFRVYEFRSGAEENMPAIFQYIFSGVSKVVTPVALILAIHLRSNLLILITLMGIILLFGITNHKSVLFFPIFVAIFFMALKKARNLNSILYLFVSFGIVAALEALYFSHFHPSLPGLFNGMITRRAFFVPPLLDSFYLDFFSEGAKYYWSTSKFGLGIVEKPYAITAPYLIGAHFFQNEATSANTGMVGSGFSHAGYIGVIIYASLIGILLAFLQSYGRKLGHAFTSSASLSIFISVVTSTDFTTAILTHGILLLIIFILFAPKGIGHASQGSRRSNDHSLHHRTSTY